jgi:type I restriction enzyme, S subunit
LFLPDVEEQKEILKWIASETSVLSSAQERAENEVGLLREYRTRLIADVVTGKIDVQEAASKMSAEVDELEERLLADETLESGDEAEPITEEELDDEEVVA